MIAQILSIGSELISGQTPDTNGAWLARQLSAIGISCTKHLTVGDDQSDIVGVIATASKEAGLLLISGGIGPTPDDLTRHALAGVLGTELELDSRSLERIETFFRRLNRRMIDSNRVQAMIPRGTDAIENTCGTAPGMYARLNDCDVYVMPGVPREMRTMFDRAILPRLREVAGDKVILHQALHSFGLPESELGDKLADMMHRGRNPSVGTGAADLVISIRIVAEASTPDEARVLLENDAAEIRSRLGEYVFGQDDETLAHAVARLLIAQRKTVATAESCTGGLIAKCLTDVPGSSAYVVQGLVTYADRSKHRLLGIPSDLIETHGAVSREVAEAMATNCRRISNTNYALAVTGIAGPTGGTPEKPVGLVYLALAHPDGTIVKRRLLGETLPRNVIRDRTAKIALNLLRLRLIGLK